MARKEGERQINRETEEVGGTWRDTPRETERRRQREGEEGEELEGWLGFPL